MVDVSAKSETIRTATASGRVVLGQSAFDLVAKNQIQKGDVLTTAKLAGIMAAKKTSELIPLCHGLNLSSVDVSLELKAADASVAIRATARTKDVTGVEMEALTAVSVAALTVYDMCKAVSKSIEIQDIVLEAKTGGKSGDYNRLPSL
eukprot:GILJ01012931.1.p1 GENE.GILJ01012931.1~~GILJ01012931.1.p1  ORF type:complete len:163 (+),score=27.30 GILJ01012931.1:48-491(+)